METIGYVLIGHTSQIEQLCIENWQGDFRISDGIICASIFSDRLEAFHVMTDIIFNYDCEYDGLTLNIYPVNIDLNNPEPLNDVKRDIALNKLSQEERELFGIKS